MGYLEKEREKKKIQILIISYKRLKCDIMSNTLFLMFRSDS